MECRWQLKVFCMAIGEGITNCQNEREITATGFRDLLKVVQNAKNLTESNIKAILYDIITNPFDNPEEKNCQKRPLEDTLNEQEETDIRIRRAILIGLFAFWEVSIKEICEYYKVPIKKNNGQKEKTWNKSENPDIKYNSVKEEKKPMYNSTDYISSIYDNDIPENVKIIDPSIKELRNFMTHGSTSEKRNQIIETLADNHPEFDIKTGDSVYLSSYDGLVKITELIETTLNSTEKYIIEKIRRASASDSE